MTAETIAERADATLEKSHHELARTEEVDYAQNLAYRNTEDEPELHSKTYVALLAMLILNMVQLIALQGPATLLDDIGLALRATESQTWIPNALILVQAVVGPLTASISDLFQVRKSLLVGCSLIAFIGSGIAPGSSSIGRLIAAQTLIGFGFAVVPLAYAVPSEILPKRWRPATQAGMNIAACLGACLGPVIIGAFAENDRLDGWRRFYWVQMGFWGLAAAGISLGYSPPRRHTKFNHLSWWQKVHEIDLIGCFFLCAGLATFLTGLCLGGGLYTWTNARVLATLVVGVVMLIGFGFYEAFGTKTGILHHDLFSGPNANGRALIVCMILISVESILAFAYLIFYPSLITSLFTTEPMGIVGRIVGFWAASAIGSVIFGYFSTRYRTVREPLAIVFLIFTGSMVGFACVQPNFSTGTIALGCVGGVGFGGALILIVATVQLSTPHNLIATATAVLTSTRALVATVFTAIYAAVLRGRLNTALPTYVADAAAKNGLPAGSITAFVGAFLTKDTHALGNVPGVSPTIIAASAEALKQAFADSFRVIYIIAAPFGIMAVVASLFVGCLKPVMNYEVDAPVEELQAKDRDGIAGGI